MKSIFFLLMVLLCSSTTLAFGLSGSWSGQGQIIINGELQPEPCQLKIDIEHTDETFCVLKSEFKCPGMNILNKHQTVLQIQDGHLVYQGQVMGTISENHMTSIALFADGREQSYYMTLNGETLNYRDHVDWAVGYTTEISGPLTQLNSNQ